MLHQLGRAIVIGSLLCAGCASLPEHVDRPVSHGEGPDGTALGTIEAKSLPGDQSLVVSGFRLLPTGAYGLDARLALIRAAQKSLEVQYYLIAVDDTGKQFFGALRDAAKRGVRVRLLIDDLYVAGQDPMLGGLESYPNVEIRLFNPFTLARETQTTKVLLSLTQLARVDRRMHNKLMVADGAMAISGGRNVANEYFTRAGNDSFVDLDVLSVGPIVRAQQTIFDTYWNSDVVFPLDSIAGKPGDPVAARKTFDMAIEGGMPNPPLAPTDLLGLRPVSEDLSLGDMELHQAIAQVIADSPEKAAGLNLNSIHGTVIYSVDQQIEDSRTSILIVSPYFIPGAATMKRLEAAIARGVKITVVTNSLAATDVPLVYAGYKKPRDQLLKLGVKVYELSQAVATEHIGLGNFRSQLGRLHAKTLVVDGRRVFIGSMNMDGRSAHENTETGIILESETIGGEIQQLVDRNIANQAYEVKLIDGQVRWLTNINGREQIFDTEQNVSAWTRIEVDTLGPLAPDNLL